ncbi:MAG: TIGR02449 family protein [Candidatus Reddybacter sp.]
MSSDVLSDLENKIDQLVELSERLQRENTGLRQRESTLLKEKGQLMEKTEQARSRVESMIARLKALNPEA